MSFSRLRKADMYPRSPARLGVMDSFKAALAAIDGEIPYGRKRIVRGKALTAFKLNLDRRFGAFPSGEATA